jgi:hypothetical protein
MPCFRLATMWKCCYNDHVLAALRKALERWPAAKERLRRRIPRLCQQKRVAKVLLEVVRRDAVPVLESAESQPLAEPPHVPPPLGEGVRSPRLLRRAEPLGRSGSLGERCLKTGTRRCLARDGIEYILIGPLDRQLTVEIGYRVAWDEEHTLGARFRDGQLVELSGSVLRP